MTTIKLLYGKTPLTVDIPDGLDMTLVEPRYRPGIEDPHGAIRYALNHPINARPLADSVQPHHKVGIVVNDITQATPYAVILPALLAELRDVPDAGITVFVATGTHRPNTAEELEDMLGPGIVGRFTIVQNDAQDKQSHITVGTTSRGGEVRILRRYCECDIKILTGFIEPHFFAGFSGGGKAVMPGLADLGTIINNHSPAHIDHPQATWGRTADNPIARDILEAAMLAGDCFLLNVALNKEKRITGVFAGHLADAHAEGCAFVREQAMAAVDREFDIAITSNSGHPLDLNMYQSVKGLSAAARIVKQNGTVIMASECWDGIPDHGHYRRLLAESATPDALLAKIHQRGFVCQDMWQAQVHAKVCQKADVYFYSDHLTDEQITSAMFKPCRHIPDTLNRLLGQYGPNASICILPEGPLTIPYVAR
jgi:nickel-dependent lactate racemase